MSEPWNLRCLCLQNLSLQIGFVRNLSSLAFLKIPLFGWSIVSFNRSLCLICLIKTWIILIQFENPIINIFLIVKAFLKIKLFVFSLQSSGRKFELKIRTEKVLNDQFFSLMIFHSHKCFSTNFHIIWLNCWQILFHSNFYNRHTNSLKTFSLSNFDLS